MGLQIILLHDLREGRSMVWSRELGDEAQDEVDIFAEMQATLAKADENHRPSRYN